MSFEFTHFLSSHYNNNVSFETQVKETVQTMCRDAKPSEKVRKSILQYAASYECLDTKIGKVDVILN